LEELLSVCLGIGLASACGFRIFIPPLVLGIAARAGHLELGDGMGWLSSNAALITLGVAALLEIAAYYVPWLDNLLDTVAAPSAVVAGIVVSGAAFTGMSPMLSWTLAVIAGGGAAAVTQLGTTAIRAASTATTGGVANPVVSTVEAAGATGLSLVAVVAPFIAGAAVVLLFILIVRGVGRRFARRTATRA
jgi:hypothetical protein